MNKEKIKLMSNNCVCSIFHEPFLMVFQEVGKDRWELFQGLMGACKPHIPPERDELFNLDPDVLRYGVSVSPDYQCPNCGGNSFALCSSCLHAVCSHDELEGIVPCPVCGLGAEITEAKDVDYHND